MTRACCGLYADFIREADGPLDRSGSTSKRRSPPGRRPTWRRRPGSCSRPGRRDAAGLGGVRHLDTAIAEVKSMYVAPRIAAAASGAESSPSSSGSPASTAAARPASTPPEYLTPAVALYRAAGYAEVPDYNGNPKADLWFERAVTMAADRHVSEPVHVVPYDPGWPASFEAERASLEDAIGGVGHRRHPPRRKHRGARAGGEADRRHLGRRREPRRIDATASSPSRDSNDLDAPYLSTEMHWFWKPHPARRTHHLHLAPAGGRRYADELAFRDHAAPTPTSPRPTRP